MTVTTKQVLKILYILSWIIFIGVCIEAGGFTVNSFFALVNPTTVKYLWLWQQVDLSGLFKYDTGLFFAE